MTTVKTYNDFKRVNSTSLNTKDYPEVIVCTDCEQNRNRKNKNRKMKLNMYQAIRKLQLNKEEREKLKKLFNNAENVDVNKILQTLGIDKNSDRAKLVLEKAKSQQQLKMIYAIRNKYKTKKDTPEDEKWVWDEEWTEGVKMKKLPKKVKTLPGKFKAYLMGDIYPIKKIEF